MSKVLSPLKKYLSVIIGIIIISAGTYVGFSFKTLGIIIVGIGTFVLTFATLHFAKKDNDKTKKQFEKMINSIKTEIISVKSMNNLAVEKKDKIENIENDFLKWAENFTNQKALIELEFKKEEIERITYEIEISNRLRKYAEYFIQCLSQLIDAYNNENKINLLYDFKPIPQNLFVIENKDFIGYLKFHKNLFWLFNLSVIEHTEDKADISLNIEINVIEEDFNLFKNNGLKSLYLYCHHDLYIHFFEKSNSILINNKTTERFKRLKLNQKYMLSDYKTSLTLIIKKILEYQLLLVG